MNTAPYKNTIKVYDQIAKDYLKYSSQVPPRKRAGFARKLAKGANILDAGCGGGRDAKFFVGKGLNVTGIDLSKESLKIAQKEVPKATFKVMDLLNLKFSSKTFDAIWAQASLVHLRRDDAKKVIKSFNRILKPKGFLHVRVKKGKGEALVKEKLSGGKERFFSYFGKNEIEKMMKDAGFKIVYSDMVSDELGRKDVKWVVVWGQKPIST